MISMMMVINETNQFTCNGIPWDSDSCKKYLKHTNSCMIIRQNIKKFILNIDKSINKIQLKPPFLPIKADINLNPDAVI